MALVSRWGSIDWCCLPEIDSPSCFGRLIDWEAGGHCTIQPAGPPEELRRRYLPDSLVLETTFRGRSGEVRLLDFLAMRPGGRHHPRRQLVRILEGVSGTVPMQVVIAPRFEYGGIPPWIRDHGGGRFSAIGGAAGLAIASTLPLEDAGQHGLAGRFELHAGERRALTLTYVRPDALHPPAERSDGVKDEARGAGDRLEETVAWWREWVERMHPWARREPALVRSAITLKGLVHAPSGAIAAAPTTSLPEVPGGVRNWDYRFCWVRDSSYALRSLGALGCVDEADRFRSFLERTTAGSAAEVRVLYGVDGRHRLPEVELSDLAGYRGARPVRIGNFAGEQLQLDVYGELLDMASLDHGRDVELEEHYGRFLVEVVELVRRRWREPDNGLWELRSAPEHHVHSKALCWLALDRGLALAETLGIEPERVEAWASEREWIRAAIEREGHDRERGVFVRAFGTRALDAALLQLPRIGFVPAADPRMVRTADAIRKELDAGAGLIRRYDAPDGLPGREGAFVAASYWLAECYALQERLAEAEEVHAAARATANDLGLHAEEFDPTGRTLLGNFPQGLSHYAHISAEVALRVLREARDGQRERRAG